MKPRCLEDKFLGWSATGELLPCCWYDNPNKEYIKDLLDEKFRISYNNTVEDVLKSKEWKDFFDRVKNNPDSLPPVCHRYCG